MQVSLFLLIQQPPSWILLITTISRTKALKRSQSATKCSNLKMSHHFTHNSLDKISHIVPNPTIRKHKPEGKELERSEEQHWWPPHEVSHTTPQKNVQPNLGAQGSAICGHFPNVFLWSSARWPGVQHIFYSKPLYKEPYIVPYI
jgi:hypothetical protein